MKHLTNKIFKDTLLVSAANMVNYAGMFILAVLVSRILGVLALGEFTLVFAVSAILTVISEFGLSQLLIRKINSDRGNVFSFVKNVNLFKLILSAACIIIALLTVLIINKQGFIPALAIGIFLIIPKTLQSTYEAALRSLLKQILPSAVKSVNTFIQIVLAYIILINNGGLTGLFIMLFITESLTSLVFREASRGLWLKSGITVLPAGRYSFKKIKPVIKESFPFFGSNLLAFSIPRVIIIILGNLSSQLSLGIYSAASRFAAGIGLVSGALYNTFYPAMTDPDTPPEMRFHLAKKFTLYAFLAGIVISLAIYFSAGMLINLTFKIPEAVPVLKLLAFSVIPVLTYTVLQSYLLSVKYEKFIVKLYAALWLLNILLCLTLISAYGYMGAAVTSVIVEYTALIVIFIVFITKNKSTR